MLKIRYSIKHHQQTEIHVCLSFQSVKVVNNFDTLKTWATNLLVQEPKSAFAFFSRCKIY